MCTDTCESPGGFVHFNKVREKITGYSVDFHEFIISFAAQNHNEGFTKKLYISTLEDKNGIRIFVQLCKKGCLRQSFQLVKKPF